MNVYFNQISENLQQLMEDYILFIKGIEMPSLYKLYTIFRDGHEQFMYSSDSIREVLDVLGQWIEEDSKEFPNVYKYFIKNSENFNVLNYS